MNKSSFGQPQKLYRFNDICGYLQNHHLYQSLNQEYDLIQRNSIPCAFFQFARDKFRNNYNGDAITPKSLSESDPTLFARSDVYNWTQDGDFITIKKKINGYHQSVGEDGKVSDIVKIDGDAIISDYIEGRLFEEPLEYDIKVNNGNELVIQMKVKTENWPILIIGPSNDISGDSLEMVNMDLDSAFLLAIGCMERIDICERLLLFSAWRSHYPSILYMTKLLTDNEDALFYWSCKLLLEHMDTSMLLFIGVHLTYFKNSEDYIVAENIFLLLLWEKRMPEATRYLGMIHLADVEGFNSDPSLAFQYFKYSAEKSGDQKSMLIMAQCYISGIGVDKDIEQGKKILESLGVDPKPYLEKLGSTTPAKSDEEPEEPPKDSLTSSIISNVTGLAVGIGICAGIYFLLRRRSRK